MLFPVMVSLLCDVHIHSVALACKVIFICCNVNHLFAASLDERLSRFYDFDSAECLGLIYVY